MPPLPTHLAHSRRGNTTAAVLLFAAAALVVAAMTGTFSTINTNDADYPYSTEDCTVDTAPDSTVVSCSKTDQVSIGGFQPTVTAAFPSDLGGDRFGPRSLGPDNVIVQWTADWYRAKLGTDARFALETVDERSRAIEFYSDDRAVLRQIQPDNIRSADSTNQYDLKTVRQSVPDGLRQHIAETATCRMQVDGETPPAEGGFGDVSGSGLTPAVSSGLVFPVRCSIGVSSQGDAVSADTTWTFTTDFGGDTMPETPTGGVTDGAGLFARIQTVINQFLARLGV